MITYADACRVINESRGEAVAVTTMTQTKYWNQISGEPDLDVGIANAMSKASSVALGVALGDADRAVYCLDSDGSLLMNFGSLATIAGMAPENLYHFVFNNGIYAITGGQPVPAPGVHYARAAEACGYVSAHRFDDIESFDSALPGILASPGPVMIELIIKGEPQTEGVDQTWESNARLPQQLRALRKRLTNTDNWGSGGPYI
jgi:thiamine pyrophosphate-dependent acetolactate synthase large subunit-like protein